MAKFEYTWRTGKIIDAASSRKGLFGDYDDEVRARLSTYHVI